MLWLILSGLFLIVVLIFAVREMFAWNRSFKRLRELNNTLDRTPDVLRVLWERSQASESVSLKLLSRIQKIEHKLDKLEKPKGLPQ